MNISIGDLFKKGEFWTNLEKSLGKLAKKIKQNSSHIKELEEKNNLMIEHIKWLKEENKSLSDRLLALENRVWNLHVTSKPEGVLLVSEADKLSKLEDDAARHNKRLERDASR